MPDIAGDAIDRVITIEAKNRANAHGVLAPMYEAARRHAGGRPVTMVAAEKLKAAVGKGDTVLIVTGAAYYPAHPKGEADGPPGSAVIARAVKKALGAVPVYACETCHVDPIVAASQAAGIMVRDFEVARDRNLGGALSAAPERQEEVAAWVQALYEEVKPKAVVSVERLGPGRNGLLHYSSGRPIQGPGRIVDYDVVDISPVFTEAGKRGILTIGIGDHGNELGFDTIRPTVEKVMPNGATLCTSVGADVVIPAMISNWGGYGLAAALAFLVQNPDVIHTPAVEEHILRACLDAGGLDGMRCTMEFFVDGLDGETSLAVVQFLSNIVRKNLEPVAKGLAH